MKQGDAVVCREEMLPSAQIGEKFWARRKVTRFVGEFTKLVKEALRQDSSRANASADVRKFSEKGL